MTSSVLYLRVTALLNLCKLVDGFGQSYQEEKEVVKHLWMQKDKNSMYNVRNSNTLAYYYPHDQSDYKSVSI